MAIYLGENEVGFNTTYGGIVPSGTSNITSNGIYNVYNYSSASVNVPTPSALVFPTSTSSTRVGDVIAGLYPSSTNRFLNIPKGYNSSSGAYVISGVQTTNLTASNIAEGVTVKIGDAYDASRILQVTGTYSPPSIDYIANRKSVSGNISGNTIFIDDYAFHGCSKITTASFPEATHIYAYAFFSCPSLTAVDFPKAKYIGSWAFYTCRSLTTLSFPSVEGIENNAFYQCASLTTANFPKAAYIGSSAFMYCGSLTTANFPELTGNIYSQAFYSCGSLTTISFPKARFIYNSAFYSCKLLNSAIFPMVSSIYAYAFQNCYAISIISFPNVTDIDIGAFDACSSITTVNLSNLVSLGSSAFRNCSGVTTVNLPNVQAIGAYTFYSCWSLNTVSLGNVSSIGSNAFRYCYNLLSLYMLGSSIPSLSTYAFYSTPIGGYTTSTGGVYGKIFVPASLYNSYKTATNWSSYSARMVSM